MNHKQNSFEKCIFNANFELEGIEEKGSTSKIPLPAPLMGRLVNPCFIVSFRIFGQNIDFYKSNASNSF